VMGLDVNVLLTGVSMVRGPHGVMTLRSEDPTE